MNAFKLSAVALALAATFSASAMTSIQDTDLSQVSGQEGVSIIADMNVNIGSFSYIDDGASVSFNNISITGMRILTIDVLTGGAFSTAVTGSVVAQSGLAAADAAVVVGAAATATGFTGQDVVQIAFPVIGSGTVSTNARLAKLSITVASITTGHGGASFGGIQLKNMDMQGTKIWMYGHQ